MLAFEYATHALDIGLIFGRLRGVQAYKIYFLHLKDLAMINLPDNCGFGYRNQIAIDFHIDDSVYCFDGCFFIEVCGGCL